MEGDMREIVLQRLEQRLKEKDQEIHALKGQLRGPGEEAKGLTERVDALEAEIKQVEIALTEVMKMVSALDVAMNTALMAMADTNKAGPHEECLAVPGGMPVDPQMFEDFAADADRNDAREDGHQDKDATRFFHLGQNS